MQLFSSEHMRVHWYVDSGGCYRSTRVEGKMAEGIPKRYKCGD